MENFLKQWKKNVLINRSYKINHIKDIVNNIVENKGCSLTCFQIGKYDNESYVKTTERITYTVNEDINEEEMKSDISNNNIHDMMTVFWFEFELQI